MDILICNDEAIPREILRNLLEELNDDVIETCDGQEAVDYIKSSSAFPDLIIMDVNMLGMNGYDAAKIIKCLTPNIHIPILFYTSLSDEESLAACLNHGDDFISSPVTPSIFYAKIKAHKRIARLHKTINRQNIKLSEFYKHIKTEHELAEDVFEKFMSQNDLKSSSISFHISPASTFNGDLLLVKNKPSGGLYILVGDITGHGLPAALSAIPAFRTFTSMADKDFPIGTIAKELNRTMSEMLLPHMLFAAALIEINAEQSQARIWSGGMPDIVLVDNDCHLKRRVRSMHMPLGALKDSEFDRNLEIVELKTFDRLYAYTDGVIEATNRNGQMFESERLYSILTKDKSKNKIDQILNEVNLFSGGGKLEDDATIIEFIVENQELTVEEKSTVAINCEINSLIESKISFQFTDSELKLDSNIAMLCDNICSFNYLKPHKDIIFTVISEMYSNSLEHGVLKLDSEYKDEIDGFLRYYEKRKKAISELKSGFIRVNIQHSVKNSKLVLDVEMTDSGDGFLPCEQLSIDKNESDHGRGLTIIRGLSESVVIRDSGRTIQASLHF